MEGGALILVTGFKDSTSKTDSYRHSCVLLSSRHHGSSMESGNLPDPCRIYALHTHCKFLTVVQPTGSDAEGIQLLFEHLKGGSNT